MRFYIGTILLLALAAFATADDRLICQAKSDKYKPGVWCAIDMFCNSFGPSALLQNLYSPATTKGFTCDGPWDTSIAYMRPKNCQQNLGGLTRANCFSAFYGVCANGGKKGRGETGFGPKGCIKVGIKEVCKGRHWPCF